MKNCKEFKRQSPIKDASLGQLEKLRILAAVRKLGGRALGGGALKK
ncbi:MAG: hypothetical protein K5773_05340 [Pseudobutyrivibrio sp.]|nr:hypothetical protein [Pseudobutyrivibrio sp.]